MKSSRVLTAVAVLSGLLLLAVVAHAAVPTGPVSFTDRTGEAGTAPDISGVTVAPMGDGRSSMAVTFAGASTWTTTPTVAVLVDVDRNPSTGDSTGTDVVLAWSNTTGAVGARWNGTSWVDATFTSLGASYAGGSLTFTFDPRELGSSDGTFGFRVMAEWSATGDIDIAPDTGLWTYGAEVTLRTVATLAPPRAKAGGEYDVAMVVTRSDSGGFVGPEGDITCSATIGGRRIAGMNAFVTVGYQGVKVSAAVCGWHVPKWARGRQLTGTMSVTYAGSTATRSFHAKIR